MVTLVESAFDDMPFSLPALIETERLLIRIVEEKDIADLFDVNGDDAVTQFLPYASWQNIDDGKAWYIRMSELQKTGSVLQFVIIEKILQRAIGTCLLFQLDQASARAEIGYVMGRAWWKRGYTCEAMKKLINYAFEDCDLRRLEAEVDPKNLASNNLLLKLGFRCEGLLRQRWVAKGNVHDTNIYGLLRQEFQDSTGTAT